MSNVSSITHLSNVSSFTHLRNVYFNGSVHDFRNNVSRETCTLPFFHFKIYKNMSFTRSKPIFKTYSPSQKCTIPTQENLAITPARMAEMVDNGIPVSSNVLSGNYDDGVPSPAWDIPIDRKRGVDVAEVWQAQKTARKTITSNVVTKE